MTTRRSVLRTARIAVSSAVATARLKVRGTSVGRVTVDGLQPVLTTGGSIQIGELAVRGRVARCEIGAVRGATLHIGRNVFVNQGASVVAHHSIQVGDDVRIGDFVAIYDSDFHALDAQTPLKAAPVILEQGCWIGRSAIVLAGTTVGRNAVVAAGSVVTHDVPAATLVGGAPATVIRTLSAPEGWVRD